MGLMPTTDMADTAVVTDMVDIVASDLPLLKLIPMLKPKLTVTVMAVDTDTEIMVDTVEVMEVTDMVDTVERGPLMPKLIPMLLLTTVVTDTEAMVDTVDTAVDTEVMVDTVEVTTDRFYQDLFLSKIFFIKILFLCKICSLVKKFKKDQVTRCSSKSNQFHDA